MDLATLKKEYEVLAKKYKLPEFRAMNERFEIDRIERDVDFLAREVRKVMMEKIIGYIRFLEMMLSPANAPPMFLLFIKSMTTQDREVIEKAYKACIELELASLRLEIDSNEKEEAAHIVRIFESWDIIRLDMKNIIAFMERNWNAKGAKNGKGYFG